MFMNRSLHHHRCFEITMADYVTIVILSDCDDVIASSHALKITMVDYVTLVILSGC